MLCVIGYLVYSISYLSTVYKDREIGKENKSG
jgi:hypothetical protein